MAVTQVLNYGGGIQTVAMCVLVSAGKLPVPDYVVMADTGREMPTTFAYLDHYVRPLLAGVGLAVHVAPHSLAKVDLYGHNGQLLPPAYTVTGRLDAFCSNEWKARVVARYLRSLGVNTGNVVNWIGYSLDEVRRVRCADGRYYPLVDLMLTRLDCVGVIESAGLPLPHKSRCWMCPHQNNQEWREVAADAALWSQAVALDEAVRVADKCGGVFLHHSAQPLAESDLSGGGDGVGGQCGLGACFV